MGRGISYLAFGVAFGAAVAAFAAGGATPAAVGGAVPTATAGADQLQRFARVFDRVRQSYVDKPDDDKMIVGAINGMLASLDPHS